MLASGLIVLLLAFIATGSAYLFWRNYQDTYASVQNHANSASQVVSTNVQWAFESARQILRRVDDSIGPDLTAPGPQAAAKLAEAVATLPGAVKVYVVDASGKTQLTTDPDFKPIEVRDREYFAAVAAGERWHVSSLLVSRLNGQQIFTISKRIERNGSFAGAAILSFNSDLMQGVWQSLSLDEGSTVGLLRDDGQLVSRYPLPDGPLDLSNYILFTDYLPKANAGTYETISPADGVHRIVGYRRVPGTNLIALSSVSTDIAFSTLNAGTLSVLALALPAALGLILVSYWTFRLLQKDARQREIEAQFQTFAEAMPNHVWTSAPNGTLDWFNSRVYEYAGAQPGELDGQAWTRIVHPDDLTASGANWAAALASGQPYETEFRLQRHDGAYRWHIARAVPIPGKSGAPLRWIGTNTDIDEQKRSAQALAESEARLRLAIGAGQLAVWELDLATLRITPSPALNQLYGFPPDASPSTEDYLSRYAPGERERVDRLGAEASARGDAEIEVEVRHIWPDGTEKWLLIRALTLGADQAGPARVIGVAIDITERKTVEQALMQSERRFRLSQQAAGIASLELDVSTGTVLGSDHFWEIWGLGPRDSVHISVLENIVIPDDEDIRSNAETRRSGTAMPNVEYRIRRPDNGQLRWLSRHIEFTYDTEGKPLKMFGIMQDITEAKQARARQEMLTHELEHRIKNILSMVSAIASQTLRNLDLETARAAFTDRLQALALAHDILNTTRWTEASMAEVIEATIVPLPRNRLTVSGPMVSLQPKMALSLALAVNELGTNALKYGALSNETGSVEITWSLTPGEAGAPPTLVWRWLEQGGPEVIKPSRRGFGTMLLERVLSADFGGAVQMNYDPAGLQCQLTAPFSPA
ncbi:PAS domain-containing protein [Devosia sp.]|uniref:PAS domain-containing protein n=1 Tax=Devosia sp. TaxID=1871048 RepID=UPI0032654A3A